MTLARPLRQLGHAPMRAKPAAARRPDAPPGGRAQRGADRALEAALHGDLSSYLRDPASLVQAARSDPRVEVPHRAAMRGALGAATEAAEVHAGPVSAAACAALGARALTAWNVVILGSPSPRAETVAHELTHVIQQDAVHTRAPAFIAPRSLPLTAPSAAAEHEARHSAAMMRAPRVRAPIAVYREEDPAEQVPSAADAAADAKKETVLLRALRAILARPDKGLITYRKPLGPDEPDPVPGSATPFARFRRKESDDADARDLAAYAVASKEPWKGDDLQAVAEEVRTTDPENPPTLTAKAKAKWAQNRTNELFTPRGPYKSKETFEHAGEKIRVSRVGAASEDRAYESYVFVGRTVTGQAIDDAYFLTVQDTVAPARKPTDYVANARRYKTIAEKVVAFLTAIGKKPEDIGPTFAALIARVDAFLEDPTTTPAKITDAIRQELRAEIVARVDRLYDLHVLFEKKVFAEVSGYQGAVLAYWVSTKYAGLTFDPKRQPVFDMSIFPVDQRKGLPGERNGDGVIAAVEEGTSTTTWIIAESKGYTTAPTKSQIEQMQDYDRILTFKWTDAQKVAHVGIPGVFLDVETGKTKSVFFSKIHYYFSLPVKVKDGDKDVDNPILAVWKKALKDHLPGRHTCTPDATSPKSFETATEANPIYKFKVTDGDVLDHHFDNVKVATPGVTLRTVDLKLATYRSPEIASGSMTMDTDLKGAVSQKDVTKTIVPVPADEQAAPKPGKPKVWGRFPAKSKGGTSALDKILAGVDVDVRLTDDGLTATITVKEGKAKGFDFKSSSFQVTMGRDLKPKMDATLAFGHQSGKVDGSVKIAYDGANWNFKGTATVTELIKGLKTFQIGVEYKGAAEGTDQPAIIITVPKLQYERTFGGVTILADITEASYDVGTESFAAKGVSLSAVMGPFGTATGTAVFEKNELTSIAIDYASPVLTYPRASKAPLISGTLTGNVTYTDGAFAGGVKGDAVLDHPALRKLAKGQGPIGLGVEVAVDKDGNFSGSLEMKTELKIGKYFSIKSIKLSLLPDGDIAGSFGLKVSNIPHLKEATATCRVDQDGFHVDSFSVTGEIEQKPTSKFWGTITASYVASKTGGLFKVGIDAYVKLGNGIIGHGKLAYDSETDLVTGSLSVEKIKILGPATKEYKLFEFEKQIELISLYKVLGLYLDVGVKLSFEIGYSLTLTPTLSMKFGIESLEKLSFKGIAAAMVFEGSLTAALKLEPKIGLGLFVLSTKLLRLGGGLKIPITAKASVDPKATINAWYAPQDPAVEDSPYELGANAQLALVVKFSITGQLKPYAEFVVLDGAFRKPWDGDSLGDFTLMKERELFRYVVDLGKPIPTGVDPALGPNKDAPKVKTGAEAPRTASAAPHDTAADKTVDEHPPETKPAGKEPEAPKSDDGDGFSLKSLMEVVKNNAVYKTIADIIQTAADVFGAIGRFFQALYKFIKKWVGAAMDAVLKVLKGIKKHGLFGYLKIFLLERIGKISPTLAEILEPLLTALADSEDVLRDTLFAVLDAPLPSSIGGFLEWAWGIVKTLVGGAWNSLTSVVTGLEAMVAKAGSVAATSAGGFVNELVQAGKLGVRRHPRYVGAEGDIDLPLLGTYTVGKKVWWLAADEWKIDIGGLGLGGRAGKVQWPTPSAAVGYGLWFVLNQLAGVHPTNMDKESHTGDALENYWTPRDEDG